MTDESLNLRACPFCGGNATATNYVVEAAVRCGSCGATVMRRHPPTNDDGLPEAIAAWNRRTPQPDKACESCEGRGWLVRYHDPYNRGDVSSPYDAPCEDCTPPPPGAGEDRRDGDTKRLDWLDRQRQDDVQPDHDGYPSLIAHYWNVYAQAYDVRTAIDDAMRGEGNGC